MILTQGHYSLSYCSFGIYESNQSQSLEQKFVYKIEDLKIYDVINYDVFVDLSVVLKIDGATLSPQRWVTKEVEFIWKC